MVASACASPGPPRSWDRPEVAPVWPSPPEPARVRYVGEIHAARDLGRVEGFWERLRRWLFGAERAEMVKPVSLGRNAAGLLAVADPSLPTVHFFDLEARRYWSLPESLADGLVSPVGIAIDDAGRVYVADSGLGRILVFDRGRRLLREIGAASLRRPTGLALDPTQERLYVVDTVACEVVILDREGREVGRFGGRGTGPGQFNGPTFVAVGRDGAVRVADSLNFRVQTLTREGVPISSVGRAGDVAGSFARPKGIGVDASGRVYVVDAAFQNVQVFDPEARLLLSFGGPGTGPGEFSLPAGLFLDRSGTIWIADSFNRRIQAFRMVDGLRSTDE